MVESKNPLDELTQLRAQLATERRDNARLRDILQNSQNLNGHLQTDIKEAKGVMARLTSTTSVSRFMSKLPLEVRTKIYSELLVNPELGEISSLGKNTDYGKSIKFELSPAILRTCKAIYDEALPVLYGSNTFIIECIGACAKAASHFPQSPLTRYVDYGAYKRGKYEVLYDFSSLPVLKLVKNWRVITSTYKPSKTSAPAKSFVHFCQALANTPPRTLELIVALEKATTSLPATSQVTNMKSQLDQLFQPLTLLKLVSLRNFRAGQWDELQLILFPAAKQLLYFPKIENAGDAEAIALLTEMGKKFKAAVWRSASTNVVDMHAKLISYAQSFERNEEYRKDMAAVQIHDHSLELAPTNYYNLAPPSPGNPYKSYSGSEHPLEKSLERATRAKDQEDATKFKKARADVLEYLEPQCKSILRAGTKLRLFVVDLELEESLWSEPMVELEESEDPDFVNAIKDSLAKFVFTLEQISKTFNRKLLSETKILLRRYETSYDLAYDSLPREQLFKKLSWALKQDLPPMVETKKWMKLMADDMYAQYLQIGKARKTLFDSDVSKDRGCKINMQAHFHDEPLNWEAAQSYEYACSECGGYH